jgi:chemotaxis protein MotB
MLFTQNDRLDSVLPILTDSSSGRPMVRLALCLLILLACCPGCRQPVSGTGQNSPLFGGLAQNSLFNSANQSTSSSFFSRDRFRNPLQIQTNTPEEYAEYSKLLAQVQQLNERLGGSDSDNQQLIAEIAGLKQKLQVASDYNQQIRQQLADNAAQFQQLQLEKQQVDSQLAQAAEQLQTNQQLASTHGGLSPQLIGGATVRANNSLLQKLSSIQIPGGQARMDGDVIRVEFPSDVLFQSGTYEVRGDQVNTVRNIATTVQQQFPQQIVGIEAHWDGTALNPPTVTHHQLTATQSLALFNQLVQFGLPANQLFTMAMGSNRPRYPNNLQNGISPNRRIEIVIYPERFDN